jgi:transcriptional regulator with XRE-family HTH domain
LFWERFYHMCMMRGTKPNPVAKEIGVSSGSVTKWKTCGTLPNGETLIKIADHLDCSVDYLLGRTDNPEVNR